MNREPMIFAVAGMIFGFVLGYMVANFPGHAEARPVDASSVAVPSASPSEAQAAETTPLDPNEVRALQSLAERDKTNAQVRVDLGNLFLDHQRHDEAARYYREALAIAPDNLDVRVDLGACLVNLHKADEAIQEFEAVLKKDPGHKKALFNKGVALMESGRPDQAASVWEGLLKRYPGDPQLATLRDQIDRVRAVRGSRRRP